MATKVPTEILIKILNNLQSSPSTQDLYSSLLVNRIWCKVTIPILWELPFGRECFGYDKKLSKKALCIRTYISCMDTQARNLLIQNGFDLSSSPPQATFNYPSFTHKFIINNLVYFISKYSKHIIGKKIFELRILFREISRLIITRCSFLNYFKLARVSVNYSSNYSDSINSFLKLPGAPKVFKKLESFTSTIGNEHPIGPLYESLILICDNILNMDLFLGSEARTKLSTKLISVQKRLENLSLSANNYLNFNSLLWAIISQKETLKSLHLKFISFKNFEGKSSQIGQFTSLQELYIKDCYELHKSECLFLASSFTQLSSFHFIRICDVPQEFIIKILETANSNLKNICLELYSAISFEIFSAILNYCTRITELTLYGLSSEQVIAIFNNNFNDLRRFRFYCREEEIDATELLYKMAENVPESFETIEIRMKNGDLRIFSANSLRNFSKGGVVVKEEEEIKN
ncbi:137_t:CDS:1 [Diversispora eburnea]|uniref:137_t:CDS:1 n=1 Tax=Diversispora eburnea TaxID=1213867 RepID=A0A9N8ZDT6_9GLOM|nr:137_t:CDS:1 [Diversispora eburnea]